MKASVFVSSLENSFTENQDPHDDPAIEKVERTVSRTIAWSTNIKYLGITLDHNLRYNTHLKNLKTNYWKKYFLLIKIIGKRSKLSLQNKIIIYKIDLRPSVLYGCQIWANMARDKILQIQCMQNMSIRRIPGIPRFIPISVIHEELKIEPVASRSYNRTFIQQERRIATPPSTVEIDSGTNPLPPTALL
ncbi:putative RNA-directed DNA polymerase from transposon X-element [Trichonephila clavata]|uniref:Putative RNA-directed DNA polymerase from transposon X-element n=1 Tax=Trichonephila clavata TaxID=2740835 RepID=A0A8X6JHD8_TRICU|nr:putative RNA-directed DNA polymerase from transposon X-element [Trichonephila clavata]